MKKIYVLATSTLLHTPQAPFVFEDNQVVIPLAVIEEIDNHKKRQDEIGRNAREVSRILDQLRDEGDLSQGAPTPQGGSIRVEVNQNKWKNMPEFMDVLDKTKPDNRILAVALNLSQQNNDRQVFLISKDLNLRIKADVLGVKAQDLINDRVDFSRLYSGQTELYLNSEEMNTFFPGQKAGRFRKGDVAK
ncbi:MAG: hypothetical protein HQK55_08970 [Deltaproteobacteria bacterium]|nr:hypothetical protein [Deltaproteobacteria bacterium]